MNRSAASAVSSAGVANGEVRYAIDSAFPGGNVIVERLTSECAYIRPDLRDTTTDWFYWCFRVAGAQNSTLKFEFTRQNPVGARGPAVSHDDGLTWRYLPSAAVNGSSFQYKFSADEKSVIFSFGMTYTQRHLDRFLQTLPGRDRLRSQLLCRSKGGRDVVAYTFGNEANPRHRIFITARHHACEMMASYPLEGILQAITADDEVGRFFQSQTAAFIVPFVDRDGVEAGDQGKNRTPRDHNRDYNGEAVHAETSAIRRIVPKWCKTPPDIMLDLHCPWMKGGINEVLYQVGSCFPEVWKEQQRFGAVLEKLRRGPIPYTAANDLPYGRDWNTAANEGGNRSSANWGRDVLKARYAGTLEVPYANASGVEVNAESGRALGQDLAVALRQYLTT